MQEPIREQLEEYLSGMDDADRREFEALFAGDAAANEEIGLMRQQSQMLQALRAPTDEEFEPAPGFYARVMERIESERPLSVWDVFLQPVFARRLAYVSLALLLVLGVLTVRSEMQPALANISPEAILAERPVSPNLGRDHQRDREAVLVNLATYSGY